MTSLNLPEVTKHFLHCAVGQPQGYEATIWERLDDLVWAIEKHGLDVIQRASFTKPLKVEQLCLQVTEVAASSDAAEPALTGMEPE